jgi:hypothetical protein
MRTHEPKDPEINVGDRVRLKQGTTDIAYDDMVLDGWTGTICDVNGEMCCVRWSEETQGVIPQDYRERWRGSGIPVDSLWLPQKFVEPIAFDDVESEC